MMVDYSNGIDVGISDPIIYKQYWYFLMESVSNGCMFSSIPIVKSQIDAQLLKKNIYMLQLFDSIKNIDILKWIIVLILIM